MTLFKQILKSLVLLGLIATLTACIENGDGPINGTQTTFGGNPGFDSTGGSGTGQLPDAMGGGDDHSTIGTGEGKGDSGGTNNKFSTIEQVRNTILEVRNEMKADEFALRSRFHTEFNIENEELAHEMLLRIFFPGNYVFKTLLPKPFEEMDDEELDYWTDYYLKWITLTSLIENTEIKLIEEDCVEMDGTPADASVTAFELGADICFSLTRMQRIPPESLKKHVYAVWFHELAHIVGYKEEARVLEDYILYAYEQTVSMKGNRYLYKVTGVAFNTGLYVSTLWTKQIPQAMSCGYIKAHLEDTLYLLPTNDPKHSYVSVFSQNNQDFFTAYYLFDEIQVEMNRICRTLLGENPDGYEFTKEEESRIAKMLAKANHFLQLYLLGKTTAIYNDQNQYENYPLTLKNMGDVREEYKDYSPNRPIYY